MRRLWLIFAQTVTVCLGILFIVSVLRPHWLGDVADKATPAPALVPSDAVQSYAGAVQRAAPAVVNIYTARHQLVPLIPVPADPKLEQLLRSLPGFTQRRSSTSLGSGVIVRADGYILTNHHVIESADAIQVALHDGRQATAHLVGDDPESDLAVLRIDLPDLPVIAFSDRRTLHVGDVVLA
ncbi:MAG TPA: trypsin-like peptidase domain-containing protein, partial [Castellaniella sp.]|nr:trypsin-like peptidase domain-containing protein [Castellaniella sp.]